MPQVPTYGAPKVARDPLSAGKLNPVQSDAGEVIGKALGGLGDALQGVGQTAHKLQLKAAKAASAASGAGADDGGDDDDDQDQDQDGGREVAPEAASDDSKAAALEAQRQADQDAAGISDAQLKFSAGAVQQLGPDGGLTGLTGRDALAAAPQVRQGIGDAFNDAVDSLPPGPARAQGLVALKAQRAGAERLVDRHMADQPAVQLKQSLAARVVGFQQQTAPLYLIDPALAEHNLDQMDLAQRELDLRSGVPVDRHLANQLQNHSTAWSSLVQNRIAAGDWHGAQAVLKDRAGELTYADRTRLAPAVTDGANMADGQAWAQGSLSAGWAGLHVEGGGDPGAAPPVGVDPQAHRVRAAASAAGATLRERERLVAETITGGLDPGGAAGDEGGEGGNPADAAVAAALDRDRTAQQTAGRALGREPDDWQVAFVARQPTPRAAAALLAAPRDGDAAAALAQAGVPPEAAQALITAAGARPGDKVGEVLDAARDGYGRALQQAAKIAAERPQALFTPDHLPDQEAYLALADLAAGPDPMRRKVYRAAAATRWRDLFDAQQKKRIDAWDAVAPELSQGVPYSKWDPAKQAALDPEDRKFLAEAEARLEPTEGDPDRFYDLRKAYVDGTLDRYSPADQIQVLSREQFKTYMQWREDMRKSDGQGLTRGQVRMHRALAAAQDAVASGAWSGTGRSNGSGTDPGLEGELGVVLERGVLYSGQSHAPRLWRTVAASPAGIDGTIPAASPFHLLAEDGLSLRTRPAPPPPPPPPPLPGNVPATLEQLSIGMEERESRGNDPHWLHSSKGAYGAMQLQLGTARGAAARLGLPEIAALDDKALAERLKTDVALNRRLGTEEIRDLLHKFDGNQVLALAAYNAGRNKVLRWLANPDIGDPRTGAITVEQFLARIPSNDVRIYVHDVQAFTQSAEVQRKINARRAANQ